MYISVPLLLYIGERTLRAFRSKAYSVKILKVFTFLLWSKLNLDNFETSLAVRNPDVYPSSLCSSALSFAGLVVYMLPCLLFRFHYCQGVS